MDAQAEQKRAMFPRGLAQPRQRSRFSLDPLLLAAFATVKKAERLLDLGTGCGVAGLAALLLHPEKITSALGLEIDPELAQAAGQNGLALGLPNFTAIQADIRAMDKVALPESFTLALANPPYRSEGTGQACPDPGRAMARIELNGGLDDFLRAGAWALVNRGRLAVIYPAARLAHLFGSCRKFSLEPKRLCLVQSRCGQPAKLALVEAVKNGGAGLIAEPAIILHQAGSPSPPLETLAFCRFLGRD